MEVRVPNQELFCLHNNIERISLGHIIMPFNISCIACIDTIKANYTHAPLAFLQLYIN